MTAKEEIIRLVKGLPDCPTFFQAFDCLRPLYDKEVAPIIAGYNPLRPQDHWRRDISNPVDVEEQGKLTTTRTELVELMQLLSDDAVEETVNEAMYKLVLFYGIELARKQSSEGDGVPHEEVKRRFAKWRG